MPATDTNLTTLFGTGVKLSRPNEGTVVDQQRFGFPGIDGVYVANLGETGVRVVFQGTLRVTAATKALAGTGLNTIRDAILALKKNGTVLNIITGATGMADYEALYGITGSGATTPYRRVIVQDFREDTKRSFSPKPSSQWMALVDFICVFQKVA